MLNKLKKGKKTFLSYKCRNCSIQKIKSFIFISDFKSFLNGLKEKYFCIWIPWYFALFHILLYFFRTFVLSLAIGQKMKLSQFFGYGQNQQFLSAIINGSMSFLSSNFYGTSLKTTEHKNCRIIYLEI